MTKKFVSMFLALVMCLSLTVTSVFAYGSTDFSEGDSIEQEKKTVEEYLNEFHKKTHSLYEGNNNARTYSLQEVNQIRQDTVTNLCNAGYMAYDVTRETYENIQQELNTDLSDIGVQKDGNYIIVVCGETYEEGVQTPNRSTPSSTFTYKYNGVTYTMRTLIVTAADDYTYGKATSVNLLSSYSRDVIERCLDTMITAIVDYVTGIPLGTVGSILGLSVSNFSTTATSILNYNAYTNWTRFYTQVWSDYYEAWANGSCVEYVNMHGTLQGVRYDPQTNSAVDINKPHREEKKYSENFYDLDWRKEQAVIGYSSAWPVYDNVGGVKYEYGNKVIVTHAEDF